MQSGKDKKAEGERRRRTATSWRLKTVVAQPRPSSGVVSLAIESNDGDHFVGPFARCIQSGGSAVQRALDHRYASQASGPIATVGDSDSLSVVDFWGGKGT